MKFCFLNEYEGEKEIYLNDTNVKFTYKEEGESKTIELDYKDIDSISFYKYKEVFELMVITPKTVVDLNIEFNDKEKIGMAKELYFKMLSIYRENRPEEKIYHYLKEDEDGNLMEFNIQSKMTNESQELKCLYRKTSGIIILSVFLLLSTFKIFNII